MKQLKLRQICLFFICVPITKMFVLPSIISSFSGQDLWISGLINLLIDLLSITLLLVALKNSNLTFKELLILNFGKVVGKIIYLSYAVLFFVKAILPMLEEKEYVELTLYITTSSIIYFFPFFIFSFYFCLKKLRIIGRVSDVLCFIFLASYILMFFLSLQGIDFGAIFPVGENFTNVIKGSASSYYWFGDAAYFLMFLGNFEKEKKYGLKIILSYIIPIVLTVLFLIVFYGTFVYISFRQRFALTETTRYSTVINNIGRFDFLGIFGLLFTHCFMTVVSVFFCVYIICDAFDLKAKWIVSLAVNGVYFIVAVYFSKYYSAIENFIINYGGYYCLVMGVIFPVIFAFCKKEKNEILKN